MQCFRLTTRLAYVFVFVNLILMSEAKSVKRYKRRNEDLLNNLNNTFATLMNFMMDPNENAQLTKEFTKEFSKDQFFNADGLQSLKMEMPADYQDLLSNNSVFNQQLANYEGLNSGLINSLLPSSTSPSSSNSGYNSNFNNGYGQTSARQLDQSSLSNYFSQVPNTKSSYDGNSYSVSPEQLAQAPTYMENPPVNQIEIGPNDQLQPTNLIVDDNFNQFSANNGPDSDSSKGNSFKSTNYLPNYSDLSKYGKIKVSDFANTDSSPVTKSLDLKNKQPNLHFYELVNDDTTFSVNDFKKKPISVSSSSIPLKYYNEESRKTAGGFRSSFTPEFDLDQFQMPSVPKSDGANFKIDTNSNYFDKTRTKDPISEPPRPESQTYNPAAATANSLSNSLTNSITSSLANSISNSLPNGFVNGGYSAAANGGPGEQRITSGTPGNNVVANRIVNNPLQGMVSSNEPNMNYYNNHLQLPSLVYPNNNNQNYQQNYEIPIEKSGLNGYGIYSGYGGSPKYGGGGYSIGHGGGYSMGHGGGYSMGHGGGYSIGHGGHGSYPMLSYSSGSKYGGGGGGHYSMPMISYSSGHKGGGYGKGGLGYNIKATVNAKVTPSISHGGKSKKSSSLN